MRSFKGFNANWQSRSQGLLWTDTPIFVPPSRGGFTVEAQQIDRPTATDGEGSLVFLVYLVPIESFMQYDSVVQLFFRVRMRGFGICIDVPTRIPCPAAILF
jgi:hypothetical protein